MNTGHWGREESMNLGDSKKQPRGNDIGIYVLKDEQEFAKRSK